MTTPFLSPRVDFLITLGEAVGHFQRVLMERPDVEVRMHLGVASIYVGDEERQRVGSAFLDMTADDWLSLAAKVARA